MVSFHSFNSNKIKRRVSNPRTKVCFHFKLPFESSSLSGAGTIFTDSSENGRFPYFQSSNFQFESLKSGQFNCGCFFDTMSAFNVPGSRPNKNTMKFRKPTELAAAAPGPRRPAALRRSRSSRPLESGVSLYNKGFPFGQTCFPLEKGDPSILREIP